MAFKPFYKYLLPVAALSLGAALTGCNPSNDAGGETAEADKPSPSGEELVEARKKAISSPEPALEPKSPQVEALIRQSENFNLTPEQKKKLEQIQAKNESRLADLAKKAQEEQAKAEQLAAESNRGEDVSLQQVRSELAVAAKSTQALRAEHEKAWKEAMGVLTEEQRKKAAQVIQ